MSMRWLAARALAVAAACGMACQAQAANAVCTVSSNSVLFGNYDPTSSTPLTVNGSVTVSCTALLALSVPYTILLSAGNSGSVSNRAMTSVFGSLPYNLYTTGSYSTVWDNTTGVNGTVAVLGLLNLFSGSDTKTVFGRIPIRQLVRGGAYADSIVITVNY